MLGGYLDDAADYLARFGDAERQMRNSFGGHADNTMMRFMQCAYNASICALVPLCADLSLRMQPMSAVAYFHRAKYVASWYTERISSNVVHHQGRLTSKDAPTGARLRPLLESTRASETCTLIHEHISDRPQASSPLLIAGRGIYRPLVHVSLRVVESRDRNDYFGPMPPCIMVAFISWKRSPNRV